MDPMDDWFDGETPEAKEDESTVIGRRSFVKLAVAAATAGSMARALQHKMAARISSRNNRNLRCHHSATASLRRWSFKLIQAALELIWKNWQRSAGERVSNA